MAALDDKGAQGPPRLVKVLWILVAITAALSLLYAIQYYLGGPIRLSVVSEIKSLDLSPDGTQLAAGNSEGKVDVWAVAAEIPTSVDKDFQVADEEPWPKQTLAIGSGEPVWATTFTPDGGTLVAAAGDGIIRTWSVPDYALLEEHDLQVGSLDDAALSENGQYLAALAEDGTIHIFDRLAGQSVQTIGAGDEPRLVVAINADGTLVAAGWGSGAQVWNAQTGEQVQTLETYCEDPTLTTEEACDDAREDWLGHDEEVTALAFSPDGELLASGSADTTVMFWELETGDLASDSVGHWATVTTMTFSEDSAMMLTGGADYKTRDLRVAGGKSTAYFEGHLSNIQGVVYGPSDASIITAGDDGTVRVWETANQYLVHLEWSRVGLQPTWGRLFAIWMLISGILGFVALYGLRRSALWSHLLILAMYLVGPIIVLGLPLLEVVNVWWLVSGALGIFVLRFALRRWQQRRWLALILVLVLWLCFALVGFALLRVCPESWQETPWLDLIFLLPGLLSPLWPPLHDFLIAPLSTMFALRLIWPLLLLGAWYVVLLMVTTREEGAVYYEAPQEASLSEKIMVSQRTLKTRFGIFSLAVWVALLVLLFSILRKFNLDIAFMANWLEFIMRGSYITLVVSAASIVLATILALLGALGRLSKNPIANAGSGFYISLIRGTPLLVQIYIWYLGLPRLGIVLPPIWAGILALGVNYGAYMTEIFRAGIQAVSIGQREAAQALGMTGGQTFRRIILPQAFRIVIPPIGNQFIAMMKDSSLVSVMAVQELTWSANKVGRQYFRGMETFIIAAAFYWILTVIFQLLQGRLEEYMARGERR